MLRFIPKPPNHDNPIVSYDDLVKAFGDYDPFTCWTLLDSLTERQQEIIAEAAVNEHAGEPFKARAVHYAAFAKILKKLRLKDRYEVVNCYWAARCWQAYLEREHPEFLERKKQSKQLAKGQS